VEFWVPNNVLVNAESSSRSSSPGKVLKKSWYGVVVLRYSTRRNSELVGAGTPDCSSHTTDCCPPQFWLNTCTHPSMFLSMLMERLSFSVYHRALKGTHTTLAHARPTSKKPNTALMPNNLSQPSHTLPSTPPIHHTPPNQPTTLPPSHPHNSALRPLQHRTLLPHPRLLTSKKILPTNPAPLTHTPENPPGLVVEGEGRVEFRDVAGVHDEDAVVAYYCFEAVGWEDYPSVSEGDFFAGWVGGGSRDREW